LKAALLYAAQAIAAGSGQELSQSQLEHAIKFEPEWIVDRCEVHSLWP
jgi:hypothetical protein